MDLSLAWLQSPLIQRVGWTLLHFLWQGALVAALFAAISSVLQPRSSNVRYLKP